VKSESLARGVVTMKLDDNIDSGPHGQVVSNIIVFHVDIGAFIMISQGILILM
jgi:hypothetical protein